ncbi:hypothetical protein DY000_02049157 [Brassica cretica]|uniref:Uncharacterized protein n=1 Tax=Brassica cretica TaxID=69181 RepID=A0ABQ7EVP5_BRACR|nr:hypothetical protein DY000_02049157 [Brassica cretica]
MSNNKRFDRKLVPNKKQVQFKLVPKIHVYRTIADPKSRVEIVCAEQVVGVYVRQAMITLRNVLVCIACIASDKLVAKSHLSKHEDMMVAKRSLVHKGMTLIFEMDDHELSIKRDRACHGLSNVPLFSSIPFRVNKLNLLLVMEELSFNSLARAKQVMTVSSTGRVFETEHKMVVVTRSGA